jgi:hypothetical protein
MRFLAISFHHSLHKLYFVLDRQDTGSILFIYSLFNDAFSDTDYIASNERVIVNNELERMWKEVVVA